MRKKVFLAVLFLLIVVLSIGCTPARRVEPRDDNRVPEDNNRIINDPQNNMVPNQQDNIGQNNLDNRRPNETNQLNTNDRDRNRRLADMAADVKGVKRATVVTTGDTAYVGIDIDKDIEGGDTERLKEKVGEALKNKEDINKVYVSADMDSVERLKDIGRDIEGGRPISGFLNELTELFRRPMPKAE